MATDLHSDAPEKIDAATGQTIRHHDWDGIQELNTPMPRWWVNTLYATIIWSIGYWIVYPAWPLVSDYTKGVFGWSSRAAVIEEVQALQTRRSAQAAGLKDAPLEQIRSDQNLSRIALAQGRAAFGDNCAPCHGTGGAGSKGYPNLNDDDWLWGGKLTDIEQTLKNGIRHAGNDETRLSVMSAFGRDGVLKKEEVRAVANHVRKIAGLAPEDKADLALGQKVFGEQCVSCHGDAGKGNQELGAPNLTDAIWLYGSDIDSLVETVHNGRNGVMPAWSGRLDPVTIKALTVYVHSLGGGK
ncbi:MAG: cytochrome-c oxidase, cbb3-type subunit III [Beijerinckiaceae bacterium]